MCNRLDRPVRVWRGKKKRKGGGVSAEAVSLMLIQRTLLVETLLRYVIDFYGTFVKAWFGFEIKE